MADNNGNAFFTESPSMMWDPFLDPSIPPLDLDGSGLEQLFPNNNAGVEHWLQDSSTGRDQPDLSSRHGHARALSTSAIPPEINIDFAPPTIAQPSDHVNHGVRGGSGDWYQSPTLLPFDARQRSRPSSPARSIGSMGRVRSSSTGSIQRDYILDLADPQGPAAPQTSRVQKHPATFQCTLCPKRFTRAYNLRSHLRTHTEERPFACTVCGKAFARQHDRKRHEGLHSGEKKFVCRGNLNTGAQWGCGRRYARADALYRHIRSEAGLVCIRPLVQEEGAQTQASWMEAYAQQQNVGGIGSCIDANPSARVLLPAALLAQYPALANIQPDNFQASDTMSPPSRTSSFGGSSYGSNGYWEYERSVSRQVSDTSLHSMYSATSFTSLRGPRITSGYECNQCGATFDVPSELRHHERNHLPKESRPHACIHCGERFLYPKDVQRHIGRKHPGVQCSPSKYPTSSHTAQDSTEELGLGGFASSAYLTAVDPTMDDIHHGSPRMLPQVQVNTPPEFPRLNFNSTEWMDSSMLQPDIDALPSSANAADGTRLHEEGHTNHEEQNANRIADHPDGPAIPRTKSAEILHLKTALETAERDAKLWREERNFYAELLQESMAPEDLSVALRFVHRNEIVSPVRRARGWLGGIWTLFRARKKGDEEDEVHRAASRAVVNLAAQLERMDVGGSPGGGGRKVSSEKGSRSSSPIRAKWREFGGWVSGGK